MLNPDTALVVMEIVNMFAKYKLPIILRDKIFDDVRLVMDSRLVESVTDVHSIMNIDSLLEKYSINQHCRCNRRGNG